MGVKAVTYYTVECDATGCGTTTGSLGSEYSAWSDHGYALDEWLDWEGALLPDGRTMCGEHFPADFCRHSDDGTHTPADDDPTECVDCGAFLKEQE